tara:strand:- start:559 stop:954 length:396 start_codon:yes stop_codon:yes gene_type:complete
MAKRDTPNSYFAWFNDDDRLAIVVKQESTDSSKGTTGGEYDTYLDSTVTDGIKMTVHSRYESVSSLTDDLQVTCGLDEAIHPSILDYVKSRVLEDSGNAKDAMYFRQKYEQAISKKASRKSGVRLLIVPEL